MALSEERLKVIENIKTAVERGDLFSKVELSDPEVTEEDVRRVILPFDLLRKRPINKIKAYFARLLGESLMRRFNQSTEIRGIENTFDVKGGAFITANHYNPTDSTPIRMMAIACGKRKKHDIVVQQTNIFMEGVFGFLMKNANTLPVSGLAEYTVNKLTPALSELLSREHFILVYPEQEMWYNYKKPRDLRDGVYHWAARFGVPVIPTFTEMITEEGEPDGGGFLPVKHILHIMPPIYPDPKLSLRENREAMRQRDLECKRAKYEEVYGILLDDEFIPERDIAGYSL